MHDPVIDFEQIRKEAIEALPPNTFNLIKTKHSSGKANSEAWRCVIDCDFGDRIVPIALRIELPIYFPLSFPRVYLEKESIPLIGFIPHLNDNEYICTYQEGFDIPNPSGAANQIYTGRKNSRDIIEDGKRKRNERDIDDEFANYWSEQFDSKFPVLNSYLSLIDEENPADIYVAILESPIGIYKQIIFSQERQFVGLKDYLNRRKIKFTVEPVFFIAHEINLRPPFLKTNFDVVQLLIGLEKLEEFYKYFSKAKYASVIVRKRINDQTYYFGWNHTRIVLPKGWMRMPSVAKAYTELPQRNEHIQRFICDDYSPQRLQLRTSGMAKGKSIRLGFIGLGSVGSNLLHLCRSFDPDYYFLMDNDKLEVENIARHLLGIKYCGQNKAEAIKSHLQDYRPEIPIEVLSSDLLSLIERKFDKLNECDLNFICIGDTVRETVIADAIKSGLLTKPCAFLWVEPYLASGHLIYIHPSDPKDYKDYFDEEGFYKFRVLSNDNPKNELMKKEAGCSSAFTPYGAPDLIQFLSALLPQLRKVWINPHQSSFRMSWIGNLEYLLREGFKVESEHVNSEYNTLNINSL